MEFLNNATVWVGVSFVIFILLVLKPISKMLSDNLDLRIKLIKEKINEAEKLKNEAENILSDYKSKKNKLEVEIKKMLKDAEDESSEIEKKISLELAETIKRREESYNQRLEQNKIKIQKELSNEILQAAVEVTRKRIKNDLSDHKNNLLMENSLDNIKIKLN
tara:strand:- start:239 stop:727 length:489 start_codon:yes stop_codon:yes gene_type:complete